MATYDETLEDDVEVAPAPVGSVGLQIGERVLPSDVLTFTSVYQREIEDAIEAGDETTVLMGVVVRELLRMGEAHAPGFIYNLSLADAATVRDRVLRAFPFALGENVSVAVTLVAQAATVVIERLRLTEAVLGSAHYGISLNDRVRLTAAVAKFLGAEASDAIDIIPFADGPAYMTGIVSETVNVSETIAPQFLLRVIASDRVEISDEDLLQVVFNGMLADGVEITAGLLLPGVGFTTWAMNTRTAAVTEYRNFTFNSFARIGNKYLGANENGLYELLGDDDDGEDIVATIRSGFAQWAGARLHSFKAAYLAVRGTGQFVLRLITPDGRTYNYTVSQDDMRTTKVNMGKGLRARYFAFELVSTGQDFDLETLEFIPLVAQRRV